VKRRIVLLLVLIAANAEAPAQVTQHPRVELRTNRGAFVVELYPERAAHTVEHFLRNVSAGFYDGTLFHRVLKGVMVQGGGFVAGMVEKPAPAPIENEAQHCLSNTRGTVAMAHAHDAQTEGSQFFINLADNRGLDFDPSAAAGAGYCAFGRVVVGMNTVIAIGTVTIVAGGDFVGDVPVEEIIIDSARVLPAGARPGDDDGQAAHELGDDHFGP
jgi:cyclophilin family peptidyl-prolyl cis-trans isomerase